MKELEQLLEMEESEESSFTEMVISELPARVENVEELNLEQIKNDDIHNVRENNYVLLDTAQEALRGAIELANVAPNPRAFEVLNGILKTTSELNNDLLNNAKIINDMNRTVQNAEKIENIQNNYNMSPTDLLEMIDGNTTK